MPKSRTPQLEKLAPAHPLSRAATIKRNEARLKQLVKRARLNARGAKLLMPMIKASMQTVPPAFVEEIQAAAQKAMLAERGAPVRRSTR